MKKISRRSFLRASGLLAVSAALTSCGGFGSGASSASTSGAAAGVHEPLTISTPLRDVNAFITVVHKYYPEINFEVIPYAGYNGTAYMQAQLRSGELPDIYTTSVYTPGQFDSANKLLDLSQYAFTNAYVPARLLEVASEDGSIYLLPNYFNAIGITYNKKILADNGWTLPTSLKEMEELAPKVREAGYTFCLNQLQHPGYGFQYMCNILDTGYFNSLEGREWQEKFLNGEATFAGTPEIVDCMQLLQRWRDLGILNNDVPFSKDSDVAAEMAKGNTLFMLGSTNDFTNYGGDPNSFGLMPYLSEDGSQNVYILNVSRFAGLHKDLGEPGNEQKLEDALHVMEILSTTEGMSALNGALPNTSLEPLRDAPSSEGTYYTAEVLRQIDAGYTAPFVYAGWENLVAPDGETMLAFIRGDAELDDVIKALDESQKLIDSSESLVYTTVTETISTEDCAKLVGIVFTQATNADFALISMDKWFPDSHDDGNREGVGGRLFPLPVTDSEITSILPTGWHGNIETFTLTGKQANELLDTGFNRKDEGFFYPYLLVAPDGFVPKDTTAYTVVVCGATDAVRTEGNVQDSGVLGLAAMEDYLSQFDTFSAKDIAWEL